MSRFVSAVVLALATASVAHANVEVGGTVGLHLFSDNNGIGVDDSPDADSQKNTALFAGRLGVYFSDQLGAELELGGIPGEARSMLFDVTNLVVRGSLVYQLAAVDGDKRVRPFGLVGAGLHSIVASENTDIIRKDNKPVPHFGGGVKYLADNGWGIRADVRALLPPSSDGPIAFDFEALIGVYREWGRPERPKKKELPPPPKTDEDTDQDGLAGAADKCPTEAEDKDGFQDDDGCVDADNDADGVADAADKCASEPEDKDSFQDDDGCPDPDNDSDGIRDPDDKCPADAETRNGFADLDGCTDALPENLTKAIGVLAGVNFKVNAADLLPGAKALDTVVAVLGEHKDVRLEIQVHTDDQPLPKNPKYADNAALSQARAETIKAYLVSKGIEDPRLVAKGYGDTVPLVDPKPLKGVPLNAARAKNRRVELVVIVDGAKPAEIAVPPPTTPPS